MRPGLQCPCHSRAGALTGALACRAGKLLPSLKAYIQASGPDEAGSKRELQAQLLQLDSHLASQGPLLLGKELSAGDLSLAPQVYAAQVACQELRVRSQCGSRHELMQLHFWQTLCALPACSRAQQRGGSCQHVCLAGLGCAGRLRRCEGLQQGHRSAAGVAEDCATSRGRGGGLAGPGQQPVIQASVARVGS